MTPRQPSPQSTFRQWSQQTSKKNQNCTLLYCAKNSTVFSDYTMTYVKVYYRVKTIILFGLLQMYMRCNMQGITKKKKKNPILWHNQCQEVLHILHSISMVFSIHYALIPETCNSVPFCLELTGITSNITQTYAKVSLSLGRYHSNPE